MPPVIHAEARFRERVLARKARREPPPTLGERAHLVATWLLLVLVFAAHVDAALSMWGW